MKHKHRGHSAPKTELRTFTASKPLSVRSTPAGKHISGTAIVYNSRSVDLGNFTEVVSPNALTRTLRESPTVLAFRDHKQELLLANTAAGTLKLTNTRKGLNFVITLPATQIGEDTYENVRVGNLTGVSFGFSIADGGDKWDVGADGSIVRTLLDIDLYEISPTSFAAYPATSVDARSAPQEIRSKLTRSNDIENPSTSFDDCGCDCDACAACTGYESEDEDDLDDDDAERIRSLFKHRKNS